jgi:hypothetical protein
VSVDPLTATPPVTAVVAASPLRAVEGADADVVVAASYRPASDSGDVGRRTLVLPAVDGGGVAGPTADWFERLIVDRLVTRRAAFWSRSMLELSPDGESVLVPALGRAAQRSADPPREFGIEAIGNLDGSAPTRWARGRSLSIDAISDLARELAVHRHSVAVVDGYVYVQSRWKPTEQPKDLWSTRRGGTTRGRRDE